MTKIMFLDFDGVISTSRAWVAQKHIEDFHTRWIDPIAVGLVTEACREFGYTIVVTSTWRKFGEEACRKALGVAAQFLHDDWRTKEIWPKGPNSSAGSRPAEIEDWLKRNGGFDGKFEDYIIVDDDGFNWLPDQIDRWIKTHQLDGFSTNNYEELINRNNGKELDV